MFQWFYVFDDVHYLALESYLNRQASLGYQLDRCSHLRFKLTQQSIYYYVDTCKHEETASLKYVGKHNSLWIYQSPHEIAFEHRGIRHPFRKFITSFCLPLFLLFTIFYVLTKDLPFISYLLLFLGQSQNGLAFLTDLSWELIVFGFLCFFFPKIIAMLIYGFHFLQLFAKKISTSLIDVHLMAMLRLFGMALGFIMILMAFIREQTLSTKMLHYPQDPIITYSMLFDEVPSMSMEAKVNQTPFCESYIHHQDDQYTYRYYRMRHTKYASNVYQYLLKDLYGEDDESYHDTSTHRFYQFSPNLLIYQENEHVFYILADHAIDQERCKNYIHDMIQRFP